jgi:hypothetical protein
MILSKKLLWRLFIVGKNEFIRHIIGMQYMSRTNGVLDENSTHVQAAFKEINRVNRELFDFIPYKVVFTSDDVYSSATEMRKRIQEENVIYIYDGWSGHPLLSLEDNLVGRAVHDVFAHCVCGCPFTFEGEYSAYLEQRKWYPEWTWDVLFAEIPAQTAAFYYNGNSHDFNQRAIAAPKLWMNMTEQLELQDYSTNSILDMEKTIMVYSLAEINAMIDSLEVPF